MSAHFWMPCGFIRWLLPPCSEGLPLKGKYIGNSSFPEFIQSVSFLLMFDLGDLLLLFILNRDSVCICKIFLKRLIHYFPNCKFMVKSTSTPRIIKMIPHWIFITLLAWYGNLSPLPLSPLPPSLSIFFDLMVRG